MMSDTDSGPPGPFENVQVMISKYKRQYQQVLDRWTPHVLPRWLATAGLLAIFFLRILVSQGVSALSKINL